MATTADNPPIVVGIDGSASALVALDWAVEEAAAYGWPVRLVNAYEEIPLVPMLAARTAREAADEILREAEDRIHARGYARLDVSTVAHHGFPRHVLLNEAAVARSLVVGRESSGQFAEMVLGSTSLACAAHARLPVIVVPQMWRPVRHEQRLVTVGVDGSARCQVAIEYAFATASRWQAGVLAVLAVRRPEPLPADTQLLAEQLAGWRSKYPDVEVAEEVASGHPAAVIKEHAVDADLVVVGARGHAAVTGILLGSIARAVLHQVDRPIAVVHEAR